MSRHDLMTPLHQIIGYGELLAEDALGAGQASLLADLARITDAARQARDMVDALFDGGGGDGATARTPVPTPTPTATATHSASPSPVPVEGAARDDRLSGRILVVDDSEENRQMLCRRLERQGHQAVHADSGARCLDRLRAGAFDLVLLDVMMPEMDGFAVLRAIKADPQLWHVPVVMISAQTELDGVIRCIELGAEDYLPKPFNPTLLQARVSACLEKHRLREREQAHREQNLRAEATLERHRSLAQMVAGVAHEINTPLGIASTAQSIIEQRLSSPEVRGLFGSSPELAATFEDVLEAVGLLKGNVLRAHRLVETFKKISVSQITENQETVDLTVLVADCVDLFRITARQAGLAVTVDASGLRGDPMWLGYPGCFTQVLMNLFQNIERYAYPRGAGGPVEIRIADGASGGRREFTVEVRDQGTGIAPGDLVRVFEPFFTTGRSRGGTGLGLAIVSNIVTSMLKGRISVSSEPGEGACFSLVFPKRVAD